MEVEYQHSCGYCAHFCAHEDSKGEYRLYCSRSKSYLRKDYTLNINTCSDFEKELTFNTRQDVEDYIYDIHCGGCEYSKFDRNGNEGPDFGEDSECGGCLAELNELWADFDKTDDLNLLIRRFSCGNDRTQWEGYRYIKGDDESDN